MPFVSGIHSHSHGRGHGPSHDHHDHLHHSHSHPPSAQKTSALKLAFVLNGAFALIEIFGGIWTGSVAILADAIHDTGDTLGLGLALILVRVSAKSRDQKFSYGYARFSVLSALLTAGVIIGGSIFIFTEAVGRLFNPQIPKGPEMIALAVLGVAVNGFATFKLFQNQKTAAQHEKIFTLHLFEDTMGWVLVLLGAIIIHFTGIVWIDPAMALALAGFILVNALRHSWSALKLFLQAVPDDFKPQEFKDLVHKIKGVQSYHDLHVWSLDGRHHILSVHLRLQDGFEGQVTRIKAEMTQILKNWGDFHITLETESASEDCKSGCD